MRGTLVGDPAGLPFFEVPSDLEGEARFMSRTHKGPHRLPVEPVHSPTGEQVGFMVRYLNGQPAGFHKDWKDARRQALRVTMSRVKGA